MGIQIAKKEQKLGIRASSTCTLNFDDLKVPAENVIGGEGLGYKIAIEILNEGAVRFPTVPPSLINDQHTRSHRHRSPDGRPRPGSIRQGSSIYIRAQAVRTASGYLPGHGVPDRAGGDRTRERATSHLQRRAEKGRRAQLHQGGGHGEVLGERRCAARFGTGDRMDRRRRLYAGNWHREVLA